MIKYSICCLLALVSCLHSYSQPNITFNTVASGFSSPVDVVEENDVAKRLFVVEQPGRIRIVNGTSFLATPFLDVSSIIKYDVGGERGLLSMAFHPNYTTNGYFFIWYNDVATGDVTLARYTRSSADVADAASGVVLLHIQKRFTNHNGAKLIFGTDGYLYFGTGDGGSSGDPDGNAQDSTTLLGKMLRLDVNNPNTPYYSIPPTNPFATSTTVRPEIIALGLRNPWRWSFDKATNDVWLADVGQDLWEEVNMVPAANRLNKNYGWDCLEATHIFTAGCTPPVNNVTPIFEYPHNNNTGGRSITGGYVYRGTEFPLLQGYYLFTDYVSANGWLTKPDGLGGWTTTMQQNWKPNITSFGEASNGTLYALANGVLYKVIAAQVLPVHLVSFTASRSGNNHQLRWSVENEEAGDVYVVERRTDPTQPFKEVNSTKAFSKKASNSYNMQLPATNDKTWYRVQLKSVDGRTTYSTVVSLINTVSSSLKGVIISNTLQVSMPPKARTISLFDANGKLLLTKRVTNSVAERISLQNIAKGVLAIRVQTDNTIETIQVLY